MAIDTGALRTATEAALDTNMQTNMPDSGPDHREVMKKVVAEAAVQAAIAHNADAGGVPAHTHVEADITDLDHTDPSAIHNNVAGEINAITEKTTPVGADIIAIEDSEASFAKKKLTLTNLMTLAPAGGGGGGGTVVDGAASVTPLSQSISSSVATYMLDSSMYSAWVENTNWKRNIPDSGDVAYDGSKYIVVSATGRYRVYGTAYIYGGSGIAVLDLLINGGSVWTASPYVHGSVDPVERSFSVLLNLTAGDTIEVRMDGTVNMAWDAGCSLNVERADPVPVLKKVLYGAQYSSTASNASSYPYTYWVSFFDYSYFYASSVSYEDCRKVPIPGPGNIVKVFVKTAQTSYPNTKTAPTDFQLRKNGADVAGASFSVPAGAPADTIYEVTGSWPYNDGDEMCLKADTGSTGNCYIKTVGLVVEV